MICEGAVESYKDLIPPSPEFSCPVLTITNTAVKKPVCLSYLPDAPWAWGLSFARSWLFSDKSQRICGTSLFKLDRALKSYFCGKMIAKQFFTLSVCLKHHSIFHAMCKCQFIFHSCSRRWWAQLFLHIRWKLTTPSLYCSEPGTVFVTGKSSFRNLNWASQLSC